jgi:hypothetical protein
VLLDRFIVGLSRRFQLFDPFAMLNNILLVLHNPPIVFFDILLKLLKTVFEIFCGLAV